MFSHLLVDIASVTLTVSNAWFSGIPLIYLHFMFIPCDNDRIITMINPLLCIRLPIMRKCASNKILMLLQSFLFVSFKWSTIIFIQHEEQLPFIFSILCMYQLFQFLKVGKTELHWVTLVSCILGNFQHHSNNNL